MRLADHISRGVRVLLLALAATAAACSEGDDSAQGGGGVTPTPPAHVPKDGVMLTRGEGEFVYTKYAPLSSKPVNVHYYLPAEGDIAQMPLLFAMHGAEREGQNQIDAWCHLAEAYGFIVIAPEFTKENGYLENDYQFGGIFTSKTFTSLRDEQEWTYNVIESLFDYVKNEIDNTSTHYRLFGHSAGGQFVHRFLYAMPGARVIRAVAANPGSWTFPLTKGIEGTDGKMYGWPYALFKVPFANEEHLRGFFARRLYVHTGSADTEVDEYFPTDAPSAAQGGNRNERAKGFYESCKTVSGELGATLNMKLVEVEGAGHSTRQMVYGMARPTLSKPEERGKGNAYDLLFN